jgi:hypothetical protein
LCGHSQFVEDDDIISLGKILIVIQEIVMLMNKTFYKINWECVAQWASSMQHNWHTKNVM